MRLVSTRMLIAVAAVLHACTLAAAGAGHRPLPLEGGVALGDRRVATSASVDVPLPALPAKPGQVIVVRFRMVSVAARPAGCNFCAAVKINHVAVTRYTPAGDQRLIGREAMFDFAYRKYDRSFPVFGGPRLMTVFAPDCDAGDKMTTDGLGATFALDVSDLVQGVDGNTLTFVNTRETRAGSESRDLVVEGIEVGWVDKVLLPKPKTMVPTRGQIGEGVSEDGLRLLQAKGGGFAVRSPDDLELLVETGVGMGADAPSALIADDETKTEAKSESWGPRGYRVRAAFGPLTLTRTIQIKHGLVEWCERWTNTGETTSGVPFRHRLFLRAEAAKFRLSGDADADALVGCAKNPTLLLESRKRPGRGFGVAAESDWLRLLMGLRGRAGVGEVYTDTLALAPGSSIDIALTITPVRQGGYWEFINSVRERWGVNGFTVPRPIFWSYWRAPDCKTAEERFRKSLGHLGPIYLVLGPWQRLEPDAQVVRRGAYPKLPDAAARAPGECPDLDVDAFLTWRHREPFWRRYREDVQTLHRVCPNVKVMQMMHPAMEAAYVPLHHRWPYAQDAILTAEGKPFFAAHYSRVWLRGYHGKGWQVYYYCPRPGSAYLAELLRPLRRSLDECGGDGMYCDEFSWAGRRRSYSRYDYSRWDGHSADLDEEGRVVRLKCDNAKAAESCQLQIAGEVLRRGKFFLGNGAAALRSVTELPIARFVEGGNGYGSMAGGHLSTVPLVLGNMGDRRTRGGVFESVKLCLSNGCIYSPSAVNLLLDGPDSFVCRLYPITIRRIGPGCVEGEERLITTRSGSHAWPGRPAKVRLYLYDSSGGLLSKSRVVDAAAGKGLKVDVPERGLVIAEALD